MSFVHLHTHSHYSLLDGMNKIPELVSRAKDLGMSAIALTDHGSMYGAIEFYKECKKVGIKPIVGVEAYVARRTRHDKEADLDSKSYHLTLLARNNAGYKNLMKLVSRANLEGYYYRPRMDKELLREHAEGIICLSGCPGSEFVINLKNGHEDEAKKLLQFYIEIFGKENVFVEVMKHDEVEWYIPLIEKIIKIAQEMDLPIVGTWDSHYLHEDDAEAHDTLVAINTGGEVGKAGMSMKAGNYSFVSPEHAKKVFANIPGAYENTSKVADLVDLEIELGALYFPNYEIEGGKTPDETLRDFVYSKLESRGMEKTKEVSERIDYELEIIKTKGYPSYFLIVADLIKFARENGILTNTRGSAAGSLVSYVAGITNVDPLHYKLPFERFLNPYRPSAPDIDLDIADNRRDELIGYARRKYGNDHVAQIGTFGTMMARGSVRDVARALGFPYATGDRISKLIPMGSQGFPMTITHALELEPELKKMYKEEKETKMIIDLAKKIEGSARHISVHAAGVVIAPKPVTEYTPIQYDPKGGKIITQYDMYSIEDAGLPKFDFLGIRNLAFLADSINIVRKLYNEEIELDTIPIDDKKTFEMLARGETEGLFQLNGSGMTQKLVKMKPTRVEDINVMVALYRPGPMQIIDEYIDRKQGKKPTIFYHPKMKSYLDASFGLLVFQDDLLFTAIELAGYDWGEVDKFRKAVGKKIPEEMAKQHVHFVEGCQSHSQMTKKDAEMIWDLFEPFQGYGFNKAHAASYGKLAYQTGYMKANYPLPYMAAMLTAESGDIDTVSIYVAECKRMGIEILPPDVNESFGGFTIVSKDGQNIRDSRTIRFGLFTIKNLGGDIAEAIVEERKTNGKYKDIADFLERITHKNLNKKSLEALIKSGAMDSFGQGRGELLGNTEMMLSYSKESTANKNQTSLFSGLDTPVSKLYFKESVLLSKREVLAWEKEYLGLYISGHPLDEYKERMEKGGASPINFVKEHGREGKTYLVAGIVEELRQVFTKKGDSMAFLKIADFTGRIDGVLFPKIYADSKDIEVDSCVVVNTKISIRDGEKSLQIEKIKKI